MSLALVLALYILGVGFLAMELFIPGMIVGIIGFLMVLTSVVTAYSEHGAFAGGTLTVLSIGIGYGLYQYGLRRLSLRSSQSRDDGYVAVEAGLEGLVGQTGSVDSQLRPVGMARFGDRPVTAVTRGELIERGALVKVIQVEGNRVVVARCEVES